MFATNRVHCTIYRSDRSLQSKYRQRLKISLDAIRVWPQMCKTEQAQHNAGNQRSDCVAARFV